MSVSSELRMCPLMLHARSWRRRRSLRFVMLSLSALSTAFAGPPKPRPKAPPARMHATLPGVEDPSPYTIYSGYLDAGVPPSGRGKMC